MTTVPGVPTTIRRDDYKRLIQSVGLDIHDLESLQFRPAGIYARIFARNTEGKRYLDGPGGEPAMHQIFIEAIDDDAGAATRT